MPENPVSLEVFKTILCGENQVAPNIALDDDDRLVSPFYAKTRWDRVRDTFEEEDILSWFGPAETDLEKALVGVCKGWFEDTSTLLAEKDFIE